MKKLFSIALVIAMLLATGFSAAKKGGVGPCLATCCLGPRVGLEMNEGSSIRMMEWMRLVPIANYVVPLVDGYESYTGKTMNQVSTAEKLHAVPVVASAPKQKGGILPGLAACCFGPRVGLEMNNGRNVRTIELLALVVPVIPSAMIAAEAYNGTTMTQVAAAEGLDK